MRLFTAGQMRAADQEAAAAGVPLIVLMENAGRAVADAARSQFGYARRVLVLCGKGNNGGDGYVAARHLLMASWRPTVLELVSSTDQLRSNESRAARDAYLAHDGQCAPLEVKTLPELLQRHELVIDALFGSGLSRPLEGNYPELIEAINHSPAPVLSIDVPSGVGSDNGARLGEHVQATNTVQLAGAKRSSVLHPAAQSFGAWEVADIGIPERILDEHSDAAVLTSRLVRPWLPRRPRDAHKYQVGTVLVIAGSARYLGAAELACRGALRAGAGLVTLASEARLASAWPEFIHLDLDWSRQPIDTLRDLEARRQQVRVVGPGLDERAQNVLLDILGYSEAPTVLDAGALIGGEDWFAATRAHGNCVLTPHAGEAGALLGQAASQVATDPIECARNLAAKSGAVAVIKGAATAVAAPDGRVAVSARGHPGLASGGTGDVLAGVLGAFLAADGDHFERACAAVYLHGLAGAKAGSAFGDGLIATDVIECLAPSLKELAEGG